MVINLSYSNESLTLDIPKQNLIGILNPNQVLQKPDIDIVNLQNNLSQFLKGSKNILVIVNDYTRPTPTSEIISFIEPILKEYEFRFMVACGSHRAPSQQELLQIFGEYAEIYKNRIIIHDAKNNLSLKFLGKTKRGTPIWLNQAVWQADKIITINSVEPHYFAGFTGGRKSFIPGVAGLQTITANHKLALHPQAKTLALKNNPVHEDMTEITTMIPREIFSIQTVINNEHKLHSIHYGDVFASFESAVNEAKKIFCVPIKNPVDIVIALIQPPYDINFYQSQKAIENAKLALKENGIMIVISKCREGIGDDEFIKVLTATNDLQLILNKLKEDFKLGYQKTAKLIETLKYFEIWTVMPIAENIIKSVYMKPFIDPNYATEKALTLKGKNAQILIMSDASLTVPLLE